MNSEKSFFKWHQKSSFYFYYFFGGKREEIFNGVNYNIVQGRTNSEMVNKGL